MPYAHNGACDIYYETFGDPANPTLLLVNGLGSQSINYADAWCEMFAAEGLQVVRYDNRDVGLSSRFAGAPVNAAGAAYTVSDMAADGMAVLDAIGVRQAHVMGLSMGGMIVQTMAIEHPERVITMTSVMSTTGEPDVGRSSKRAYELLTAAPATDREAHVQNWITGLREWGSPAFLDKARARATAEAAWDRAAPIDGGTGRQFLAIGASGPRADGLRHITTPTLVIHGDRDTLIDQSGGRRTAELIPGARFELIEGMGHDYPPELWRRWVGLVVGHVREHQP
ncbi:MAG: alpha/beta fold hydrolase [Ilumatobacteraceae bacterium]|nr:alpha/beta fold hydrolase [Ilumatobacter sp.]MCO5330605.1 alpha/beta fold hydrolase [Ilumatobacteraceae bacterium]